MNELTFERASELLRYDEETGKLYWKVRVAKRIRIGDEAGTLTRDKRNAYRQIMIDGQNYRAHRVAWLLHYGVLPVNNIDHPNGNGFDNRPENMRDVTNQENAKNRRMPRNNTSGHIGVYWNKPCGKWLAKIGIDGKQKHLGLFTDIEKAYSAYRKAADTLGYSERHGVSV